MEHKAVIVKTRKENTANVFLFTTPNYNKGNILPTFIKPDKVADEINLKHFEGGMLSVVLTSHKSNGVEKYKVVEEIMFEKGLVVDICIFTEFSSCRSGSRRRQKFKMSSRGMGKRLDGKRRFSTEGKGCLGWKERRK